MRRKLTTPDTWNIIAIIIAVVAIAGGGIWYFNGRTSSQEAFVVKANGKILVTTDEWATAQASSERFAQLFPGHQASIDSLVIQKLEMIEAEKRSVTCVTTEAATKAKAAIDTLDLSDSSSLAYKTMLLNVEGSGHVPTGYSLTPEAERTPTLADAVVALAADPAYIEIIRQGCSIGRLFDSLAPDGDNQKRNDAISALESRLRIDATLEYGSAATPSATP